MSFRSMFLPEEFIVTVHIKVIVWFLSCKLLACQITFVICCRIFFFVSLLYHFFVMNTSSNKLKAMQSAVSLRKAICSISTSTKIRNRAEAHSIIIYQFLFYHTKYELLFYFFSIQWQSHGKSCPLF